MVPGYKAAVIFEILNRHIINLGFEIEDRGCGWITLKYLIISTSFGALLFRCRHNY